MNVVRPPSLLTGQLIDERYRVGAVIGRGAMSEVYEATDERLGRTVALKVLRPDAVEPERFGEETALLCSLDHPHLVRLHDAGEHDGIPYLVLNRLDRTLADELRAGPLPVDAAARVGSEISSALAYLHERGIVHRDIKPSNILLRADGTACLADLGAALSSDGPRVTATGLTIGTPMYLAPEQATGQAVTPAADVYSLGLVLIEAVTGQAAFAGNQQETIAARLTRSPEVPASLPTGFREQLRQMVALDATVRPDATLAAATLAQLAATPVEPVTTDGSTDDTVLLGPRTAVLPVVGLDDATQAYAPTAAAPMAAGVASTAAWDRARTWVASNRERAALIGICVVVVVAALIGVASADGIGSPDAPATSATTSTTVATTTTIPTTTTAPPVAVVPAPAPQAPQGDCDDDCGGGGGGNGKAKGGKGDKDDD